MYANNKNAVIGMFVDNTSGESTRYNRLTTRTTDSGNVALIAYGWLKVAEYDERRDVVTVFTGHKAIGSQAVNRYLNDVLRKSDERGRETILSGESPTVDTPNDGTRFIGNYVGDLSSSKSPVEEEAIDTVIESLS